MIAPVKVALPYTPRDVFLPFHRRKKRWGVLVCHRRAGKTVAAINDLIKGAVTCVERLPMFGYVAPYRSQAKAVAWEYLKWYARPVIKKVNESDLIVTMVNNGEVRLFGADNADAMRGLGFNGLLMDEFGDFRPSVWGSVIRPTLADRQGTAVFMGTPKGKNQFWEVYDNATRNPQEWFTLHLPASKSGILSAEELRSIRTASNTTEDQYQQEYECSFEAAILGAYYGVEMRELSDAGRITTVNYDKTLPTYTAWDLGRRDDTAIWWFQVIRKEIHVIDYFAISGADIPDLIKAVCNKPYHYGQHFLPHDAKAQTLAANGKTIIEQLAVGLGFANLSIVPDIGRQDGIQAARVALPHCWFDEERCREGIEALRQYEREYDEDKKAFREIPKHNWCSHPADAFRMLAVSWREEQPQRKVYPERALMVGPENTATLNDMWAAQKRAKRIQRI
jgi:hypothetical protein